MVEGISVMRVLSKRRIISAEPSVEADKTQAKIMALAKELGREIHLFPTSATRSNKSLSSLTSHSERFLKTCKIQEAEEAEHRSKITKLLIDGFQICIQFLVMGLRNDKSLAASSNLERNL